VSNSVVALFCADAPGSGDGRLGVGCVSLPYAKEILFRMSPWASRSSP
jgi:hypothetical protein